MQVQPHSSLYIHMHLYLTRTCVCTKSPLVVTFALTHDRQWRHLQIGATFLLVLVRHDHPFPVRGVKLMVAYLVHDTLAMRKVCAYIVTNYMCVPAYVMLTTCVHICSLSLCLPLTYVCIVLAQFDPHLLCVAKVTYDGTPSIGCWVKVGQGHFLCTCK